MLKSYGKNLTSKVVYLELTFIFSGSDFGFLFVDVIKFNLRDSNSLRCSNATGVIYKIICDLGSCTTTLLWIDIYYNLPCHLRPI